ncbi:hypothetical protein P7K49_003140 [Saguinus oedipus]|uniref:Uncharacterized protein n=1 Tax=Saguinus oedipus TaxID=9490 RepID=A0ABQ9WJC4_SAGOE|nr:hypothetical protein P7K49_003140 [Saguinus oedipus]
MDLGPGRGEASCWANPVNWNPDPCGTLRSSVDGDPHLERGRERGPSTGFLFRLAPLVLSVPFSPSRDLGAGPHAARPCPSPSRPLERLETAFSGIVSRSRSASPACWRIRPGLQWTHRPGPAEPPIVSLTLSDKGRSPSSRGSSKTPEFCTGDGAAGTEEGEAMGHRPGHRTCDSRFETFA